jgi:hypothetical protein
LAWPGRAPEPLEVATIGDGARNAAAQGKTVWK